MGRLRFQLLSDDSNAGFRFQLLSEKGDALLTSEDFTDRDACLDAIRALLDVLSDAARFAVRADNAGQFLEVTGLDGRVLARSQASSAASSAALRDSLVETASEQEEYDVALPATSGVQTAAGPAFLHALQFSLADRYDFAQLSASGMAGFEPFQSAKDGRFYLHFNDAAGLALLYSRGFSSAAQRNRRLRVVAKSATLQQRYERREEEGRYLFILNARNGQEIARSRAFADAEARESALVWLLQEMPSYAARFGERARQEGAGQEEVEQLSQSDQAGFELLRNRADKQYYFLFRAETGWALLFSQGYKTSASRDQAIRTLIRLGAAASAYEAVAEEGAFGFVMRAGNRQKIARSRSFDTAEAAAVAIALAQSRLPAWAAAYGVTAPSVETAQAERLTLRVERSAPSPIPLAVEGAAGLAVSAAGLALADTADNAAPLPEHAVSAAPSSEESVVTQPSDEALLPIAPDVASHAPMTALETLETKAAEPAPVLVPTEQTAPIKQTAQAPAVVPIVAPVIVDPVKATSTVKDAPGETSKRRAAGGGFAPLPCGLVLAGIAAVCLVFFLWTRLGNQRSASRDVAGAQRQGSGARLAASALTPPAPSPSASPATPSPALPSSATPSTLPASPASPAPTVASVPPQVAAAPQTSGPLTPAARRMGLPARSMEAALVAYLNHPGGRGAQTFVLDRLRYPANSHAMNPAGIDEVSDLARVLSEYPRAKIAIHGNLDGQESEHYAGMDGHGLHQLSRIRAQCLYLRLHFLGISGERMSIAGKGKSRPITDNATEEARQRNRRIELVVGPF